MIARKKATQKILPAIHSDECPAKTYIASSGAVLQGRSVFNHCQIVGEVARELVSRLESLSQDSKFPLGAPLVAAAHDVGKVSSCFAEKICWACTSGMGKIAPLLNINPKQESQWWHQANLLAAQLNLLETGGGYFVALDRLPSSAIKTIFYIVNC